MTLPPSQGLIDFGPDCRNLFNRQALMAAHSIDAISPPPPPPPPTHTHTHPTPPPHTPTHPHTPSPHPQKCNNLGRQASPYSYGAVRFCQAQSLMMMLPIQVLVAYVCSRTRLCHHFSCCCSSTPGCNVISRHKDYYIVLYVLPVWLTNDDVD